MHQNCTDRRAVMLELFWGLMSVTLEQHVSGVTDMKSRSVGTKENVSYYQQDTISLALLFHDHIEGR